VISGAPWMTGQLAGYSRPLTPPYWFCAAAESVGDR